IFACVAQLRQKDAAQYEQFLRGILASGELFIAELGDQTEDAGACLGCKRVFADNGEQRSTVGMSPPRGPGIATNTATDFVLDLQLQSGRPLARQLGEELRDRPALFGSQIGEQIDEDGDSLASFASARV